MELQIQDLVSSIRKEGIEVANAEAESIIAEAKKKADSLLASAKAEAQQNKDAMEKEIAILKESAVVSAEQAKRDAVLAFKTEIQEEFEKILAADIRKQMSGDALGRLIRAAVAGENVADFAAEVSEVSEALKSELAAEIKNGLEIRPGKNVQNARARGVHANALDGDSASRHNRGGGEKKGGGRDVAGQRAVQRRKGLLKPLHEDLPSRIGHLCAHRPQHARRVVAHRGVDDEAAFTLISQRRDLKTAQHLGGCNGQIVVDAF